ncbi:hypothetical protein M8J77_009424 [Diaphorina citri]|nr:hypothetical protein M8J77_009424 [Diaphorina citri]
MNHTEPEPEPSTTTTTTTSQPAAGSPAPGTGKIKTRRKRLRKSRIYDKKDTAEAEEEICKVLRMECGAVYGAETWTMRKKEEKYLESFEMWVWRRLEGIKWSDRVRNEEVLRRVDEKREIPSSEVTLHLPG